MHYDYTGLAQDVRLFKALQRQRVGLRERIRAVEQGRANGHTAWHQDIHDGLEGIEKGIEKLLASKHPLWTDWLCHVRGVGEMTLAQLLGEISTVKGHNGHPGIGAFDTVSSLWKFSGLTPGAKLVKGETASYNTRLKTICSEFVGGGIIKANGEYRRIYDEKKAYYTANRPDWTPAHRHFAARRKMVKTFLSHFWEKWRVLEGYPVRLPYVIETLGHTHLDRWEDFVTAPAHA